MSRDDAALSDADLDRIERAAKMNPRVDPPLGLRLRVEGFTEEVVVALVAEVRRLRAQTSEDTWTDKPTTVAEALDNLTAENWHTERALIEAALKSKPAPLDTGRWVDQHEDGTSFYIEDPGERGSTLLPFTGEMWCNLQGPARLTAEDYEAAAAIIRNEEKTDGLA